MIANSTTSKKGLKSTNSSKKTSGSLRPIQFVKVMIENLGCSSLKDSATTKEKRENLESDEIATGRDKKYLEQKLNQETSKLIMKVASFLRWYYSSVILTQWVPSITSPSKSVNQSNVFILVVIKTKGVSPHKKSLGPMATPRSC